MRCVASLSQLCLVSVDAPIRPSRVVFFFSLSLAHVYVLIQPARVFLFVVNSLFFVVVVATADAA